MPGYRVIPLPDVVDKVKEYPKGSEVLAMFPDTTAFYKAFVVHPPKVFLVIYDDRKKVANIFCTSQTTMMKMEKLQIVK